MKHLHSLPFCYSVSIYEILGSEMGSFTPNWEIYDILTAARLFRLGYYLVLNRFPNHKNTRKEVLSVCIAQCLANL